jgi:hypothetical protein
MCGGLWWALAVHGNCGWVLKTCGVLCGGHWQALAARGGLGQVPWRVGVDSRS